MWGINTNDMNPTSPFVECQVDNSVTDLNRVRSAWSDFGVNDSSHPCILILVVARLNYQMLFRNV